MFNDSTLNFSIMEKNLIFYFSLYFFLRFRSFFYALFFVYGDNVVWSFGATVFASTIRKLYLLWIKFKNFAYWKELALSICNDNGYSLELICIKCKWHASERCALEKSILKLNADAIQGNVTGPRQSSFAVSVLRIKTQ